MKRKVGYIFEERIENRSNDYYTGVQAEMPATKQGHFRWFCGLHDLDFTFVCQAL